MNKYLRLSLIIVASLIALLLLTYAAASIYVNSNKKELVAKATAKIQADYNTSITVKDISFALFATFPNFSINVQSVDVTGPMYKTHGHKLFTAKNIYLQLKTEKLLFGDFQVKRVFIKGGNIFLYTDSTGKSNLDNFKKPSAKKEKQPTELPSIIQFNDFNIVSKDDYRGKLFDFQLNTLKIKNDVNGNVNTIKVEKNITVKSLAFNTSNGSFLTNHTLAGKYTVTYDTEEQTLAFKNIKMNISEQPFVFTGKFFLGDNSRFALGVKTNAINYQMAQTLVTPNITMALKKVGLTAAVDVYTVLSGPLTGTGDPKIVANFKVTNSTLATPLINLSNASFTGYFFNEVVKGIARKDPNSAIIINSLSANWKGIPVNTTTVTLNNLTTPTVTGGFTSNFDLLLLNNIVNSSSLSFSEGSGKVRVSYKGPLEKISNGNAAIDISFLLNSGTITIEPMGIILKKCTADIMAKNSDLVINNLSALSEKGSNLTIWGTAKNLLTLLEPNPGTIAADLHVYSPFLNLASLTSLTNRKKKAAPKSGKQVQKSLTRIDQLLEHEKISVTIKADKIKYDKLNATAVNALVDLKEGAWNIQSLSLGMTGGTIKFKGGINEQSTSQRKINGSFTINNVDARELFYGFNNFGIKGLSYKNLKGSFSANGNLNGIIRNGKFIEEHINGTLKFSLKKGGLLNFEPLLKIQEKAFKNRNLKNIEFAEISNQLTIVNGSVNIPRMQIESTALNVFIEGQYGLAGNTDLRIQVPLSNLKKRDETTPLKRKGNDARGGLSIYLRGKSTKDEPLNVTLDPLGGFRKKNTQ